MSEAFRWIREAHKLYTQHELKVAAVWRRSDGNMEQTAHGVTQAALAAWMEVRLTFRAKGIAVVGGITDYLIYGEGWVQTEAALYVEDTEGRCIYLTGCSWGYGGEGPHGTATILADIGMYPTIDAALKFVGSLSMTEPWRVEL